MLKSSLDLSNRSALEYQRSIFPSFNNISKLLFQSSEIKYFSYMRIFPNGQYLSLINNEAYNEAYLSHVKEDSSFFMEEVKKTSRANTRYVLLNLDSKFVNIKQEPILKLLHDFKLRQGLIFLKRRLDSIESFGFIMDPNQYFPLQFYINNIDFLEHFILYFREKAEKLIDCRDIRKLAVFKNQYVSSFHSPEHFVLEKMRAFIQQTQIKKYFVKGNEREIFLSKREMECISYFSVGMTSKEIGRLLNLSPRTVEAYLNKLKEKMGCNTKSKLISHFVETNKELIGKF